MGFVVVFAAVWCHSDDSGGAADFTSATVGSGERVAKEEDFKDTEDVGISTRFAHKIEKPKRTLERGMFKPAK